MLSIGVLLSGEIFRFITFVSQHSEILIFITGLAMCGAMGQLFIFFMVSVFDCIAFGTPRCAHKSKLRREVEGGRVNVGLGWPAGLIKFTH